MGLRALPAEGEAHDHRCGDGRCLVVAIGARDKSVGPDWGGYTVDEAATRHGASVQRTRPIPEEAYSA